MKTALESKREELNQAISHRSSLTDEIILKISRELDKLIAKEQKAQMKAY